jgi:transcriptional regulator with XRE-family HTH domain
MPHRERVLNQISLAVRDVRLASRLTQEDFAIVSSRTYMSSIERGVQNPTVTKIDELSEVLGLHPLSLLTLAYLNSRSSKSLRGLFAQIEGELSSLGLVAEGGGPPSRPVGSRTKR